MKKMILAVVIFALAALAAVPVLAEVPTFTANPVSNTGDHYAVYEGFGYVEIEFYRDVTYSNPVLSVADATGAAVAAEIIKLDDDDVLLKIANVQAGQTYSYTLSGVRVGYTGDYGSISGTVSVPAEGETIIRKVECDIKDREIEIDFATLVQFENASVTIMAADGTQIGATIVEWDEDSLEERLDANMTQGAQYTVTVSGVRSEQSAAYGSASLTFTAYDD